MNGLRDLPVILKWELSLAFLVLAWSLISLGRGTDWLAGLRRRGVPRNVVHLPRARAAPARPSRHPIRALAVAVVLAVLATGFAYALPNVIRIAPVADSGSGRRHGKAPRRAEARGAPVERPSMPSPDAPPAAGDVFAKGPSDGDAADSTPAPGPPGTGGGTSSASGGATNIAAVPSPEATPTPTPTEEPTPSDSPTPEPTPSPTPSALPTPSTTS